jgi:DNA-binding MurR/RpiR family transcriptional regulator
LVRGCSGMHHNRIAMKKVLATPTPSRRVPPAAASAPSWSGQFSEAGFAKSRLGQRLLALQADATASNQAVAEFLLRNPALVPALGIEEMASRAGVSPATLSRFARALGYSGYSDLRASAADTFQGLMQPVEKLRSSIEQEAARNATGAGKSSKSNEMPAPWQRSLETSLAQISAAAATLEADNARKWVQLIAQAKEVYTMGFGLSAHLAAMLALHLQPFCKRCTNVVEFGGTEVAAGRLMDIGKGDLLIVISFPRYANDALRLATGAKAKGATVVALTDSHASPFAKLAQHTLIAPATHPVLSSSDSAAVALIEALVSGVMLSSRSNIEQAEKLTDAISTYLHSA